MPEAVPTIAPITFTVPLPTSTVRAMLAAAAIVLRPSSGQPATPKPHSTAAPCHAYMSDRHPKSRTKARCFGEEGSDNFLQVCVILAEFWEEHGKAARFDREKRDSIRVTTYFTVQLRRLKWLYIRVNTYLVVMRGEAGTCHASGRFLVMFRAAPKGPGSGGLLVSVQIVSRREAGGQCYDMLEAGGDGGVRSHVRQ